MGNQCSRETRGLISLKEAMECVMGLSPFGQEEIEATSALGRITAQDVVARSNCPSIDSSLKDGIAVISSDVDGATPDSPVRLRVKGTVTAGGEGEAPRLTPGTCVRIMTGSPIPPGAEAVLASEFVTQVSQNEVLALADSRPGRNVLKKGQDIREGEVILEGHSPLGPAALGLLAAAGVYRVRVFRVPQVAIAATGSELVSPGEPIGPGQVAASNMVTLKGELEEIGIEPTCVIFKDDLGSLCHHFKGLLEDHDILITCGGVLDGDKDFTVKAMEELGIHMVFRRVRIGPGKGICMGMLGKKVIFNLPGGPPSNHVAATVLAIPGIKRTMGYQDPFPPRLPCKVEMEVKGQPNWTQFTYCKIRCQSHEIYAVPLQSKSRLHAMAHAVGLLELPEGKRSISPGDRGDVWLTEKQMTIG